MLYLVSSDFSRLSKTLVGRFYTDNFQVRALAGCSGHCMDDLTFNAAEKKRMNKQLARLNKYESINSTCTLWFVTKERMFDLCNKVNHSPECPNGCDAPCFYPASGYGELSQRHVVRALQSLQSFDAVMLMETLDDQDQSAFLADVMGVPRNSKFALANKNSVNSRVEKSSKREKTHFYRELLSNLAKSVSDLLHEENKWEILFFEEAVKLNALYTRQWEAETKWKD